MLATAAGAATAATATETVVVVGNGAEQRAFETPYAVSVVDAAALRSGGPLVNLSEALGRVPGLQVGLRSNYAQDLQISSRGFGARASFGVRGIRLLADGIPAAGPDGQGQVTHFDLAGASRIEVLRGPFSALHGTSSGGVIALVSRAPTERTVGIDVDAGSAGLRQGRITLTAPFEGGFSLRASGSAFDIDGFRPHSRAQRRLANVRLGYEQGAERVVVVLNAINQPAQDPLGLSRAQFEADPDSTTPQATQFDTRKTQRQEQAGVQWQHRFDGAGAGALQRLALAAYSGQRSVTQWQSIAPATQAAARHPGGVIDFDRRYGGIDARLAWRWAQVDLTTGVAADRQNEDRRGFENFTGSASAQQLGQTGRLRRDEGNRATSRDVYAQARWAISTSLDLSAGLRHGRLELVSSDRFLTNGDDSGQLRFGYTLPVLALRWSPAPAWSVYASAGRGHEAPTLGELAYRPDANSGFNAALRAQTSRQFEIGAKWRDPASEASAEAALFEARTENEIGVLSNAGGRSTFRNIGPTLRRGVEFAAQAPLGAQWRAAVALSWLDATVRSDFLACAGVPCTAPTVAVPAGRRIAGTLPASAFAEVVWAPGNFEFAFEGRAQGRQPVNDANSDFAAGHGLLGLRALWRAEFERGARLELLARVDNLADRRVAGSVIVNEGNQRFFEPAAGRNGLLSARFVQRF